MRAKAPWVGRAVRALSCAIAVSAVITFSMSVSSAAAAAPTTTRSSVVPSQVWTDTGVALHVGDEVAISASGRIHFGKPPIDAVAPAGLPRSGYCATFAGHERPWPAPTLACWSLIGKIGAGSPFQIAVATSFRVARDGELFVGINDNDLADNSGTWAVTTRVTPAATPTGSTAPPPGSTDGSGSSSRSKLVLGVGAAILVAALALLALGARRRRSARRAAPEVRELEPVGVVAVPADVAGASGAADIADFSADLLPERRVRVDDAASAAPVIVGGPTDVNIFEVEFPDLASLRVGYSYFPEGTVLRWRVRQHANMAAAGEFVANGGGNANHFVTIPLGTFLEAGPDGADVEFTWSIGGVPFGYLVRRDPGA